MKPARLTAAQFADHLALKPPAVRQLLRKVRYVVLKTVPRAAESVKFGCLCYYYPDLPFGAIGGNICLIEVRRGAVALSFIHGARLPDPHRLLKGRGKAKRFISIAHLHLVANPHLIELIRAAAENSGPKPSPDQEVRSAASGRL